MGGNREKLLKIRRKHGDNCWICKKPMDFTPIPGGKAESASLDHIVPRSKGGSGRFANLLLAHKECNAKRDSRSAL